MGSVDDILALLKQRPKQNRDPSRGVETVAAVDRWGPYAAAVIVGGNGDDIVVFAGSAFTSVLHEVISGGTTRELEWLIRAMSHPWDRGSIVGLSYVGCSVFDQADNETIIKAISGLCRPEVTALRIDSSVGTRTVALDETKIGGGSNVFVVVDVLPYSVTPLTDGGRELPGRLEVT